MPYRLVVSIIVLGGCRPQMTVMFGVHLRTNSRASPTMSGRGAMLEAQVDRTLALLSQ